MIGVRRPDWLPERFVFRVNRFWDDCRYCGDLATYEISYRPKGGDRRLRWRLCGSSECEAKTRAALLGEGQ